MILYTPMQLELVLAGMDQCNQYAQQREVLFNGSTLVVADNGQGSSQVVRLISTNPYDYLKPEFSPGAEIKL
ncbi:YlzJ-like family protein [Peptococcaceae bacterium 1198_IL3148]